MKRTLLNWEKISALVAAISLLVSIGALYVAFAGTKATNEIAAEALKTARQANEISLGLVREPAVLEFAFSDEKSFKFDFTDTGVLKEDLKTIVTVRNGGKKAIDGVAIEVIGIEGLTYLVSNPSVDVRPLAAYSTRLDFRSALQPRSLAHIDVRKYLLSYLTKILPQLPDKNGTYSTVVNVVLDPKAVNEATPSSAGLSVTKNDRRLLTIKFNSATVESSEAKAILQSEQVAHRVYGN